ncbi:putative SCY1 protein kinase [Paratrimastix pyriformis]|uniref:SCY1 protein kinase n=1 Tax=Paratrimastix pyriformis TaxID=342808 RepID=A0ABQ8UYN6_9EUKA|nr:putative SCY1 protein kinase [Paratrimastix pyriformis]
MKTLKHPYLLRFIEGLEPEKENPKEKVHFVTEPVTPLATVLASGPKIDPNAICWGLHQLATALNFLAECSLCLCNLSLATIFVTKSGDWRLGAFEFAGPLQNVPDSMRSIATLAPGLTGLLPPECNSGRFSPGSEPVHAIDSFMLGKVIEELFGVESTSQALLSQDHKLPELLESAFVAESQYVRVLLYLEELPLKTPEAKEKFFSNLLPRIASFPASVQISKMLPLFLNELDLGAVGARVLGCILAVGHALSPDQFEARIVPCVVKMFGSKERSIRAQLLQNLETYHQHLDPKLVTREIWPQLISGFSDTSPALRELTIKSMVFFIPKVRRPRSRHGAAPRFRGLNGRTFPSPSRQVPTLIRRLSCALLMRCLPALPAYPLPGKLVAQQVLQYFAALQTDAVPGIRTNTTICLGLVAQYIDSPNRAQILLSAFTRAMRDTHAPSRVAAVDALASSMSLYDVEFLATRVIPVNSTMTIDPSRDVREHAIRAAQLYATRIERNHQDVPLRPNRRRRALPFLTHPVPRPVPSRPVPSRPVPRLPPQLCQAEMDDARKGTPVLGESGGAATPGPDGGGMTGTLSPDLAPAAATAAPSQSAFGALSEGQQQQRPAAAGAVAVGAAAVGAVGGAVGSIIGKLGSLVWTSHSAPSGPAPRTTGVGTMPMAASAASSAGAGPSPTSATPLVDSPRSAASASAAGKRITSPAAASDEGWDDADLPAIPAAQQAAPSGVTATRRGISLAAPPARTTGAVLPSISPSPGPATAAPGAAADEDDWSAPWAEGVSIAMAPSASESALTRQQQVRKGRNPALAPHRTAPHRTAPHRTAPHRTAPHRTSGPLPADPLACATNTQSHKLPPLRPNPQRQRTAAKPSAAIPPKIAAPPAAVAPAQSPLDMMSLFGSPAATTAATTTPAGSSRPAPSSATSGGAGGFSFGDLLGQAAPALDQAQAPAQTQATTPRAGGGAGLAVPRKKLGAERLA